MAIEPLGSMMTIQAQTTTAARPKPVAENQSEAQESTVQTPAAAVDRTTPVVESVQEKGQQNENNGNNEGSEQQASQEQIRKAVEQMNKKMAQAEAVFGIHEDTQRVTIKIVDKETKEVIKELPPEKTLDMIAKVWEMAGMLVDERR